MATDIKFNKTGSLRYVAELTPDTPTVVQVKRLDKGYFTVYGSIGGDKFISTEPPSAIHLIGLTIPTGLRIVI